MGCAETRSTITVSRGEAYVLHKQEELKIQDITCEHAINVIKKYSKNGSLTSASFLRALIELGLLKPSRTQAEQKEELKLTEEIDLEQLRGVVYWRKFYSCLSDYTDESGETFNTLNVLICFILLASATVEEKIKLLYETLDWQCKGYVHKKMVRLFIKNFCVVAGEILPYFAEDVYNITIKLKSLKAQWVWVVSKMPDDFTEKVMRERPAIKKEEFISTFSSENYSFLFNATRLRQKMLELYAKDYEKEKSSPKKPRLSVYVGEQSPDDVVIIKDEKHAEVDNIDPPIVPTSSENKT